MKRTIFCMDWAETTKGCCITMVSFKSVTAYDSKFQPNKTSDLKPQCISIVMTYDKWFPT